SMSWSGGSRRSQGTGTRTSGGPTAPGNSCATSEDQHGFFAKSNVALARNEAIVARKLHRCIYGDRRRVATPIALVDQTTAGSFRTATPPTARRAERPPGACEGNRESGERLPGASAQQPRIKRTAAGSCETAYLSLGGAQPGRTAEAIRLRGWLLRDDR